ncbi:MAG: flagellar basal-body rod protein FlgG [Phycisphaerae bacterium]
MAISALYAAATGMRAMDEKLNVLANNIANIGTVGFKRSRINFEDLLYQVKRQPGLENAFTEQLPHGIQVGLGTKVSGTELDLSQGPVDVTDNAFDMAIDGVGFFQVRAVFNGEQTIAYTRAGNFTLNANGTLVLANSVGSPLEPQVTIPDGAEVQITENGQIFVRQPGEVAFTQLAQIELARFANPKGLIQVGKNLFVASDASGDAITGNPGENGLGVIRAGALELSNVDPVRELVELIRTQRYFELNSQTVQSADETLQIVANLRRF